MKADMAVNSLAAYFETNATNDIDLANGIRALTIYFVEAANSAHPVALMGMADAAAVQFRNHLKFDAFAPDWPDRDRFVLSNGQAPVMLYSICISPVTRI